MNNNSKIKVCHWLTTSWYGVTCNCIPHDSGTLFRLFHVTWHIIIGQKGGVCATYAITLIKIIAISL